MIVADIDAGEVDRVRARIPALDHTRDFKVEVVRLPQFAGQRPQAKQAFPARPTNARQACYGSLRKCRVFRDPLRVKGGLGSECGLLRKDENYPALDPIPAFATGV